MKANIHFVILTFAVLAGFAGEVWADTFAWAITLAIWVVRAYVIVKSDAIAKKTSRWFAYGTTVFVALLSIWYVSSLEASGILSADQARAAYILNIFLVILEVYIGIQQGKHPDSVALAELRGEHAELREMNAELEEEYSELMQLSTFIQEQGKEYSETIASQREEIAALNETLATEKTAATKVSRQLARLRDMGCAWIIKNGRQVAIEMGDIADGRNIHECVTIADNEKQLRTRTKYHNGQLKLIKAPKQ